uniref:CSON004295 protein n=1 Tax=Culicoides sonorensis TaxID=179676 RepID=A0A336MUR3_CULSO
MKNLLICSIIILLMAVQLSAANDNSTKLNDSSTVNGTSEVKNNGISVPYFPCFATPCYIKCIFSRKQGSCVDNQCVCH